MLAPGFPVLPSVPQEGNDKDSAPQLPVPLCWELALGAHRAGSCVVKRLLNKNIQSESMARLNLAPDSAAELSSGWQAASPQRCSALLPCKDHSFPFACLWSRARPAWISSSHSAVVQDCVRFYLCSPPGEVSLIKHSLSSAGKAVFIGKSLLPWAVGPELGSSAGCRGDGQPFHWPESLPFLDVVVWEECVCGGTSCWVFWVWIEDT